MTVCLQHHGHEDGDQGGFCEACAPDSPPEDAEAGAGTEDPGELKQNGRKPTKMNTGSDDPGDDDDEPWGDNEFRSSSERNSTRTSELRRLLERGRAKTKEQPTLLASVPVSAP